ncbi:MAG: AAA family ATPase [Sulfuriferula sp.]|nr:AAA family ATPase [Sulfuriferula sp.]
MDFEFTIKKLGNIDEANLTVKPFTVIAGENSSGKTFATKCLYCVLDALNQDHVSYAIESKISIIQDEVNEFEEVIKRPSNSDNEFIKYIKGIVIPYLQKTLLQYESKPFILQTLPESKNLGDLHFHDLQIKNYLEKTKDKTKYIPIHTNLYNLYATFKEIVSLITNCENTVVTGIENTLSENIKTNFQVTDYSLLINNTAPTNKAEITIDTIGNITMSQSNDLSFSFTHQGIEKIQNLRHIVYVDSPAYLKIRKGLQKRGLASRLFQFEDKRKYLSGYPQYIDKLYDFIDMEYIGQADFLNLSTEIQELTHGQFRVAKSGDITFETSQGKNIPLSLTAMGISNMGLLELLIRNNVINKGSFLIIDEPEAHLHPKWQVFLVKLLYQIAKAGANIIIATHSIDIIKAIENLLKQEDGADELISLNQMPFDIESKKKTELEKAAAILNDLSEPYLELYLEGN